MAMQWGTAIGQWHQYQRSAGAPATTLRMRRDYLERLSVAHRGRCPWSLATTDLLTWMSGQDWAPNTRRSVRTTLRGFYAWGVIAGHVEHSPAEALPVVKIPRSRPRPTPELVYRAALRSADERTYLALRLAGQCGLRRGEVARSRREDVEADLVGRSLRVTGKGGHVRMVPLPDDLADLIEAQPHGWLFPSPEGGHLTPNHLGALVSRQLPGDLTMHTLRHRAATVAYGSTRDLRAVQELLGHSRPETTAAYAAVADEAIRRAMLAAA